MFKNLSTGAIGIRANLAESLVLAKENGFQGVEVNMVEVADIAEQKGTQYVRDLFAQYGLRAGSWGLPFDFRGAEETWKKGLDALPKLAALASSLGWYRTATWILPFSDERPFDENLCFHVSRLRPIAEILQQHGCRFGLEYVGPATLRAGHKYPFIHDLAGWQQLKEAIGTDNIGLLLDAFHWYVSGGTVDDLHRLKNKDVVLVHLNDAIASVPRDEQVDQVRCLPGESGVIDLVGFLKALQAIGYDGPLTVEPFSRRLKEMSPQDAARETANALNRVLAAAGIK